MHPLILGALLLTGADAALIRRAVNPTVKSTTDLGVVSDPRFNRDSCTSVTINNRAFWNCRDTQHNTNGFPDDDVFASTTSAWSDLNADGSPLISDIEGSPTGQGNAMYAQGDNPPFYQYIKRNCGDSPTGTCDDGTRWAIWPDSAPMATPPKADGTIEAYTWVRQTHIDSDLTLLNPNPPVSLYRIQFLPDAKPKALPKIYFVNRNFWHQGEIPYGAYGNVVRNGVAYLYGQPENGKIGLAKVPVGKIRDLTQYQYWVNGAWTATKPAISDAGYDLAATAGGQGTFYYSEPWASYVWIGQKADTVSPAFWITTAPNPQGPWTAPKKFYTGTPGNSSLPAYSLQAHPGMVPEGANSIYLTYTKDDVVRGTDVYTTPLIRVDWE